MSLNVNVYSPGRVDAQLVTEKTLTVSEAVHGCVTDDQEQDDCWLRQPQGPMSHITHVLSTKSTFLSDIVKLPTTAKSPGSLAYQDSTHNVHVTYSADILLLNIFFNITFIHTANYLY